MNTSVHTQQRKHEHVYLVMHFHGSRKHERSRVLVEGVFGASNPTTAALPAAYQLQRSRDGLFGTRGLYALLNTRSPTY